MRPRRRYLQGNAGTEGPASFLFFDSENWVHPQTKDGLRFDGPLRLWVACYVRRDGTTWREPVWHRGRTADEFWQLVEACSSHHRPLWAFAHNLGHDLTKLLFWDHLESGRWTVGPVDRGTNPKTGKPRRPWRGRLCLEGRPTFLVVRGKRGVVKFVDTGNYFPSKLETIGNKFGIPKLPAPDFNGPEEPLWTYCTRDVDVCRVAMTELIKWWFREDCGVFQMTAPKLAMTNYQHTAPCRSPNGDAVDIILEDDSPARRVERAAYMGGRIEPFFVGDINRRVFRLDCNGLYPFVMTGNLYPRARKKKYRQIPPDRLRRKLHAYGAVADVLINTGRDGASYPVKHNGVQCHASGQFWTTLPGPELVRALRCGHVERVGECHLYSLADLFTSWSERWLQRKLDAQAAGDEAQLEFTKLVLNSLAGKFGQKGDWWVDCHEKAIGRTWGRLWRKNAQTKKVTEWRAVAGHVQKRVPGQEPKNACPAISAYVCSYGREYMLRVFAKMPTRSLLYTATDSIICTEPGFKALEAAGYLHPTEPGKFRLEGEAADATICGPNWYRFGDEWTAAGLWGKAEWDDELGYCCKLWDRLPSLMHSNPHGRCGYTIARLSEIVPTEKNRDRGDGFRVPYELSLSFPEADRPPRFRSPVCRPE